MTFLRGSQRVPSIVEGTDPSHPSGHLKNSRNGGRGRSASRPVCQLCSLCRTRTERDPWIHTALDISLTSVLRTIPNPRNGQSGLN